jgi:predicted nucleic acid-binding protein
MACIISDTGPLLALGGVGQLDILQALFRHVLIPAAVWQECNAKEDIAAQAVDAAIGQGWLQVKTVLSAQGFPPSLGDGEQQAMQLASQYPDSLLIMDDRLARREALHRGLTFL